MHAYVAWQMTRSDACKSDEMTEKNDRYAAAHAGIGTGNWYLGFVVAVSNIL